jgi:hypothetical protein
VSKRPELRLLGPSFAETGDKMRRWAENRKKGEKEQRTKLLVLSPPLVLMGVELHPQLQICITCIFNAKSSSLVKIRSNIF